MVQDAPNELSTPREKLRLTKHRVLPGHSHHHGNLSPSASGKATDKPPTCVWDPFGNRLAVDPVPVSTQANAVSSRNPETQQHPLRSGPQVRSRDGEEAPFFPGSPRQGRVARLTLKAH